MRTFQQYFRAALWPILRDDLGWRVPLVVMLALAIPEAEVLGQLPESPLRPQPLAPLPSALPAATPNVGPPTGSVPPLLSPAQGTSLLGPLPGRGAGSPSAETVTESDHDFRPQPNSPGLATPMERGVGLATPMERGVVEFEDPANFLDRSGESFGGTIQPVAAYEAEAETQEGLSPLEQRYSAWWREVLATAPVAGQPLELQSMLRQSGTTSRVAMIREYWRLSEAIMAVQIQRDTLETWRQATAAQSQQPLVRTVAEMLQQQIEQAGATVEAEQEHLGLWLQRGGTTLIVRPIDAPFLGPYDTKLAQMQERGQWTTDLAVLAQRVNDMKQEIVDDARVIDWAEAEWERARGSADVTRMAAMIQLRQTAYLLWLGRVTRYNDAIAQYAYQVAGPGLPVAQQLGMLLRQPLIDGRLVDLQREPSGLSGSSVFQGDAGPIAPVGYHQFLQGTRPLAPAAGNWQPAQVR